MATSRGTRYLHDDAAAVGERRAVLLYGDSFAQCVPQVECFQDLLNGDPAFAAEHHLLNYGVGGYGTDQILLLLQRSVDLFDDPFVVLSLMTLDLDRSVLSVRTGQKPRFRLDRDGALEREPTPILADPARSARTSTAACSTAASCRDACATRCAARMR